MPKEVRQSGHTPANECNLQGCKRTHITIRVHTFHDDGRSDREVTFCTDAHAATWLVCYALREESGWKEGIPSQKSIDRIEGIINELIEDKDNLK